MVLSVVIFLKFVSNLAILMAGERVGCLTLILLVNLVHQFVQFLLQIVVLLGYLLLGFS